MNHRALAGLLLAVIGCSSSPAGTPVIEAGKATCAECRMGVNDPAYACAARPSQGDDVFFDSIECLIRYQRKHSGDPAEIWIPDFDERLLHPANEMTIVRADFPSPMGGGYAAFRDTKHAEDLARIRGGVSGTLDPFVSGTVQAKETP